MNYNRVFENLVSLTRHGLIFMLWVDLNAVLPWFPLTRRMPSAALYTKIRLRNLVLVVAAWPLFPVCAFNTINRFRPGLVYCLAANHYRVYELTKRSVPYASFMTCIFPGCL